MSSVIETAEAVRRGERSAVEVLDECLASIERSNEALNAFVHLDPKLARRAAVAVDAAVARGDDPGLLAGVPFGVIDIEHCAGMPTTYGSLLFQGRPEADEDSVHVGRLRAAGAVPVGKTAVPEFGAYAYTETKAFGTTRNPWNPDCTPGGSSGGSAAAVAAGMVPLATAADGGGSIRVPAAFCGLPGFKSSYGRIPRPRFGASMTSVLGSLTTTVADAARHLDVAAGPDDRDRASLPLSGVGYERAIEELDVRGLRAAWSPDLGFAVVDPEIAAIAHSAANALVAAAELKPAEVEFAIGDPVRLWIGVNAIDIWQELERGMWPERIDEFTEPLQYFYNLGQEMTVAQYARVMKRRHRFELEMAAIFEQVDVVLTPSTAVPPYAAQGPMPSEIAGERVFPAMATPFTMAANLAWNPAASLPAGVTADGLPVGLQIIGRRHADDVVLRVARLFEQTNAWPRLAPGY